MSAEQDAGEAGWAVVELFMRPMINGLAEGLEAASVHSPDGTIELKRWDDLDKQTQLAIAAPMRNVAMTIGEVLLK